MARALLPLFPLQIVLFPGSRLPLHIFEDRYTLLIGECRQRKTEFGINRVQSGAMADVGCTARLVQVVQEYPDGRLDIVVEGGRRYRVVARDAETRPYLQGTVEFLSETPDEIDPGLARSTIALYNRLIAVVYRGKVNALPADQVRAGLAFVMAQKAGLDLDARQRLLETDSENDRLHALEEYMTGVLPRLEKLDEIERIVRSDGYL